MLFTFKDRNQQLDLKNPKWVKQRGKPNTVRKDNIYERIACRVAVIVFDLLSHTRFRDTLYICILNFRKMFHYNGSSFVVTSRALRIRAIYDIHMYAVFHK